MIALTQSLEEALEDFTNPDTKETKRKTALNTVLLKVNAERNILNFMTKLEKYLTNDDTIIRQRGILVIARVIERLPDMKINGNQMKHIMTFIIKRFKDYVCENEVLLCVYAVYKNHLSVITDDMLVEMMSTMFNSANLQGNSQETRQKIYEMLLNLYDTKKELCVDKLKPEGLFLKGLIQFMDAEKDPRCLVLTFALQRNILSSYPNRILSKHIEEFFDIIGCYFPLEFRTPKNDVYGVTGEELGNALTSCLTANILLSSYVLPMFIQYFKEDFDTAKDKIKCDVIITLIKCIKFYGIEIINPYLSDVYDKIKDIILFGDQNIELNNACIQLIREIINLICDKKAQKIIMTNDANVKIYSYDDQNSNNNSESKTQMDVDVDGNDIKIDSVNTLGWTTFFEKIIFDARQELKVPDAKMATLYSQILISVATANYLSFTITMKHLWKDMLLKYKECRDNKSQRISLTEIISSILLEMTRMMKINDDITTHPCNNYLKDIYKLFIDIIKSNDEFDYDERCLSILVLSELIQENIKNEFFDNVIDNIISLIYNQYTTNFMKNDDISGSDDIKMSDVSSKVNVFINKEKKDNFYEIIYVGLNKICKRYSKNIIDNFIKKMDKKYINTKGKSFADKPSSAQHYLQIFSPLCLDNKDIAEHVLNHVIDILLEVLNNSDGKAINMNVVTCIISCFDGLSNIMNGLNGNGIKLKDDLNEKIITNAVLKFDFKNLKSYLVNDNLRNSLNEMFLMIGYFISRVIVNMNQELQLKYSQFVMLKLNIMDNKIETKGNLTLQYEYLLLLTCLASFKLNDSIMDKNPKILANLTAFIWKMYDKKITNMVIANHYFECLGSLLNKTKSNKIVNEYISSNYFKDLISIIKKLGQQSKIENTRETIMEVYYVIYILKSLIIRCYNKNMGSLIEFLCNQLVCKNKLIAQCITNGFEIIMTRSQYVLNKDTKCKVSKLYQQKFFNETIKILFNDLSNKKTNNNETKCNIVKNNDNVYPLLALSYLMRNVPKSVLTTHISKLLPLMIKSLSSNLDQLKISTLYSFEILLNTNIQSVTPYIDTIIPIMLSLCNYKKDNNAKICALKCLLLLTNLDYITIQSFKRLIIKNLWITVGDNDKMVRKQAVLTRNQWCLIGDE